MEIVVMPSSFYSVNKSITDDGDTLEVDIPSGKGNTLWYVGVYPIDASTPETSAIANLVKVGSDDPVRTQVLPLGVASSDADEPHAHFRVAEMELPDDERLKVVARIYNLTGDAVVWRLVVVVEGPDSE